MSGLLCGYATIYGLFGPKEMSGLFLKKVEDKKKEAVAKFFFFLIYHASLWALNLKSFQNHW